ncbi:MULTISPECIES: hypothetical protein [Microbacterium]|uniref:hypothetical protein n=1 Tax=Microbacterium TaxID=33882 RepID=UPI000D01B195|nr:MULTISPECIES: hypothetical protein [Microbacterium]AVL98221.1 hypothetical protein C6C15_14560 [Microbacterium sp. str. 'China']
MRYWWASQGRNYATAIAQGSLWTSPWPDGTIRTDRILIKSIRAGDIVFHYEDKAVRAVSRVVAEWVPAARPTGYPKRNAHDLDAGWLVHVEPTVTGLDLDFRELPSIITVGAPGPLDRDGSPQQKYLSALSDEDGARLLERLGVSTSPTGSETEPTARVDAIWDRGETDATTIGRRRREQGQLRAFLLGGRATAACGLCGRELPASLLVAAHITPRALSNDKQRGDFASVAMLACSLGCDDLFEIGYIVVDGDGVIQPGRPSESEALGEVVEGLVGRSCAAFNERTAENFAARRRLVAATPLG